MLDGCVRTKTAQSLDGVGEVTAVFTVPVLGNAEADAVAASTSHSSRRACTQAHTRIAETTSPIAHAMFTAVQDLSSGCKAVDHEETRKLIH